MRIQSVDLVPVLLPIDPHKTASGIVQACPLVLITISTDVGVTGYGIVFCYMSHFLKPVHELAVELSTLLKGELLDPSVNTDTLCHRLRLIGTQGLVGMVLGGFDMALWDAKARAADVALNSLLGGDVQPVKPYANVGYDGIEGSADAAARFAEAGFLGVKAKIGYPTLEEDLAVIRAIREAVGLRVALMVDYNQSLSREEAILRLSALADEGLEWVEEPLPSHDFTDYVSLYEKARAPIQAGENWFGPTDFAIALNTGVKDRVMPDAQKCLGVTGWMRIIKMTENRNIAVSSHLWPEVSAQLLSITPNPGWLEYMDWFNAVLKHPLRLEDGHADIDGVVGSGVEFDVDAVRRFTVQ